MEAEFLAAAYVLHGPEAFAMAVLAIAFAAWRKWIREWSALLLALLPFVLVWPVFVQGISLLQRGPQNPDAAVLGQWFSLGAAVLWSWLAKQLWSEMSKREQKASPWWAHLVVVLSAFVFLAVLSTYLPKLARSSDVIVLTEADLERIRAGAPLIGEKATQPQGVESRTELLYSLPIADLQRLAEAGDAEAQSALGGRYVEGKGVPADNAMAVFWFTKAAEQGRVVDQWNVAVAYENGFGVPVDLAASVNWFERAAAQGNVDAQLRLAILLFTGKGVAKDPEAAAGWFSKAAAQGNADAQYQLGVMMSDGIGLRKDEVSAVEWFRKAADQGDADAQNNLGFAYSTGAGVPKNDQLATAWYLKAAEQGNALAQRNVALKLLDGRGIARDEELAYMWLLLASAQGDEPSRDALDAVEARLTPQQRASGQARARDWKPVSRTHQGTGS